MKISTITTTTSCLFCAQTKTSFSETSTKEYTKRGFNNFLKTALLTLVIFAAGIGSSWGQVSLITASDGGFENATSAFANNGWTAVGTSARTWRVGTYGGAATGTKAAYWGTATAFGGSAASAVGHFYRDIAIPAGATNVFLNYKLKYPTVDNTYDYFYVFTTTTSNTPVNGTIPTTGYTNRFTNTASAYASFTAMPQVDLTALAGTTVRLVFTFKTDAATPNSAAAVDDITLTYISASACTGTPNTPSISGATSACSGVNFSLSSAGTSAGTGITYQWQHSTDEGASWANVSGATATSLTTNATVNKQFRLVTTCSGSGSSSTSAAYAVNITAFVACSCVAYSVVTASSSFDTEISSVTVGSMTNASNTCTAAAPGSGSIAGTYANFAGIIAGPTATQGNSVPLTVVQGSCSGYNYGNIVQIYVDWNQNGAFTNAERVYESTSGLNTAPGVSGSFTVPTTALVGTTRMRIVVVEAGTAGINYTNTSWGIFGSYGETEDYCFTVTAPVPPTISSVPASACPGSTVTISGSDFMSITAVTFGGVPATSFTVVNSTTIQAVLSAPGAVVVTNAYGSATSSGNITFSEPALVAPVTNVSSVSAQFGQAVTIFVVAPSSSVAYNWYTSANPTFAFATDTIATTFACSNISVAAVLPGGVCESPRTMVSVTISSYPQIISSEDVFCGTGGGFSLTAAPIIASATTTWQSLTPSAVLSSTTANPTSTTISETSDFKLTVSAPGCQDYTVYKSIGVYPLPTAIVTTSATGVCPGTSATINSGLSAGNFTVQAVPYAATAAPASAGILMNNGVAITPLSGGTLDDGGWANVPIGFSFNYFGTSFSTIAAGTNGLLMFGNVPGYGTLNGELGQFTFNTTGGVFPNVNNPGNVIALMATDIHTGTNTTNGSIKYWTEGYAPNRKFVIEYKNIYGYFSNPQATVQCRLFETQGIVEIHIFEKTFANSSTVGLQDGSKTIGAVAPGRQSFTGTITTPEAWRFAPPTNYTTIWTANGEQIASGTNIFTQTVTPEATTLYDISYTNQTTGCASEPGSAQVNMVVLTPTPVTGVTTTSTVSQVCAGSSVPLSNDYTVSSAGLTYSWQTSIDGGTTWVDVVGATALTYSAIQNVASSYRIGISSCGGEISYAAPVAISMSSFFDCYCTPNTGTIYDEEIINVTLSTLNNSSTCTDLAPGLGSVAAVYGNYSTLPATNFYQNVPVSGSLTIGTCGTFNYTSGAAIFIDYNHNGSFSDAGERVWSNGSSANINCLPASVVPVSFTAPLSSLPGLTRMRIINSENVSGDAINPCVTPFYGEIEDYIVNVVGPPDAPATPLATAFGNCISGDTITMVGIAPEGVAYYWQTTANGTSFDNSASTWVVNGNGTYYIRAYASMGGLWSTATAITLSAFPLVTPPTAITNLSGTPYCAAVTLQAGTAPLGITYYWQGTNLTGTSIALPAAVNSTATASGTYYIAARNDTTLCWSVASSINVVVYPAPTGTALASSPASCASLDGSVLFSVSGAGTVFASDFNTTTLPAGSTLAGNDAGITTNGLLRLTSAANSKNGGILIENLSGVSANDYQVDFDFITTPGTSPAADGLSYSYGPDVVALPSVTTNPENGSGSALKLAFDAYTNGANQEGVYLMYNTPILNQTPTSAGVLNYSNNVAWRATASAGTSTHVTIKVNSLGQVSMWLNGLVTVSNQQLPPSYLSDDKSTWKHALSARTGGLNQGHFIDNLTIQYNMFEYSLTDTTWTTTNPISASPGTYNASVRYAGVGGCIVSLGSVTIAPFSMNSVSVSAVDLFACSGEVMTVNGIVVGQAAGLTYQWQISTDNGTTWGNIAGATNINVSNPQTAASLYRLGVSYCGGEFAYTSSVGIAMDNIQNCFCIPAPTYGTNDGDLISLVNIVGTTLNNNTGFVEGTPAYMFYNSLPNHTATLMPSTTYTMNVATGAWGSQGMAAWIDYNDDGIFSTTERIGATPTQIGTGYTPGAVNATGSFTITLACAPPVGLHRLRVRTVYANNGVTLSPCTNYQWGETEDYMITIAPAPSCPSSGVFAANLITPPMSTAADFTWEQGCASSTSYDFEYGPVGFVLGTGTQVLNQTVSVTGTLASYTLTGLSSSSSYDVYSRVNCSTSVSGWSVASSVSTAPSAPTTAAQTFCQGATVANLVATAAGSSAGYCNYTFNTLDSFGDGWNGAQMTVMNGTTIVATLTLAGGSSAAQTVSLQSGISYSLVWNTAGSYPEEVGVSVVNSSGVTVYSMGYVSQALAGTTLATFTGNCTVTPNFYWYSSATSTAWLSSTEVLSSGTYYAAQVINGVQSTDLAATQITIIPNTSVTTPVSACDSYSWNGTTYSASGIYTGTTENCVTQLLSLAITPSSTNTTTASSCDSYSWNGTTYSASGTYTGTTENCITQSLNLTITPSSTNTTTTSAVGTYTWAENGQTYTSSGVYTGSAVNCLTQALNLTIIPYSTTLSLKVFLDGYYQYGSNPASMVAARYLNLVEAGSASPGAVTDVDLITVQLRSATNTETIVHTATPMLQKNGSAYCEFPLSALGGSYYLVVDHKGSNPLWSANPITLTTSTTYNFANNLESAYSDGDLSLAPMHTIVSGLYGIWLGELNEDGYLDAVDYSDLELDIYASGYLGLYLLDGDFNGDTYVDASDFAVFDSNSNYGAYEQRPY